MMAGVGSRSASDTDTEAAAAPVVIKISPMAHFAVGFFALGLLTIVGFYQWTFPLLLIPLGLSIAIVRWRTVATAETVTARTLLGSTTVRWADIDGLRFEKSRWARAALTDGTLLRLPAVTFATLPLLTAASGGKVPNPYA